MRTLLRLIRCDTGATAAEFGMVLPLLLMFLIGTIDVGRFLWTTNRAEKATQMGVRYAVATAMIPAGLADYSFASAGGIPQGDPIPQSAFGGVSCTSSDDTVTCTCDTGATCPSLGTPDSREFVNIVRRMKNFYPAITQDVVAVDYAYSGLGYAGDPNGSDVVPLVTVRIRSDVPSGKRLSFTPMLFRFFGNATINLPSFSSALTMEDGLGCRVEEDPGSGCGAG
jgi:hypothetical protein